MDNRSDDSYPGVTIIVPSWNEETTIEGTVNSLLELDYPKDKLRIILVDDGSTDNTFQVMQKFSTITNVKVFHKENGGKHTAMNMAIGMTETEFVGCLDADSFVSPDALKRMIPYFDNEKIMAVSPSIVVHDPETLVQQAQKVEYQLSIYIKKMLGIMGGIHVTPGPFSIYRLKVFKDLGLYRLAHKTEDMEIAYRMQKNGYLIDQCHDAVVYTKTPRTARALYKQRLRWIYGFLNNSIDYRHVIFKKKYGTFALFTIPAGLISVVAAVVVFSSGLYNIGHYIGERILRFQAVGLSLPKFSAPHFDWFFISSDAVVFLAIILYGFIFLSLFLGAKLSNNKMKISIYMVWYVLLYSVIAPLWVMKAVFNTVTRRETAWR